MGHNFLDFHFNLFGIDHTISSSNGNESVAFQSFTNSWNLNRGYKTKVITLPPTCKRTTITLTEEKKMNLSMEPRNYINACSSSLEFVIFRWNLCFWAKTAVFTISDINIRKNPKVYWKATLCVRKISGQDIYKIYSHRRLYRRCVSFGVELSIVSSPVGARGLSRECVLRIPSVS